MKLFEWNETKNETLKRERGIGFEDILVAIEDGNLLTIIEHPNQKRYPHQQIFVVQIDDYAYLVPFVEDAQKVFLKTIFPSRKYTKQYIEKGDL
jgi:hypothetical protein